MSIVEGTKQNIYIIHHQMSYAQQGKTIWRNFCISRASKWFVKKWTDFVTIANIVIEQPLNQHLKDNYI